MLASDYTPPPPGRHGIGKESRGAATVLGVYIGDDDDDGCKEQMAIKKIHSAGG